MKIGRLKPRTATLGDAPGVTVFDRKKHDAGVVDRKRFYDSKLWQDTRAAKLARDPMCQCCAHEGKLARAEHVDHWTALAAGGHPTDDGNLVSLCTPCHSRKTHCERNGLKLPSIAPSTPRTGFGFA